MACIKWFQLILTSFGWDAILAGHFSQRSLSRNSKIDSLFLPTTIPKPLIPLTRGPPPMYWLGTSRWWLGLLCMLYFYLNLFHSGLHVIPAASVFVWFYCIFWWVFNSCDAKDIWAFGLMSLAFSLLSCLTHVLFFLMSVALLAGHPAKLVCCFCYIITSLSLLFLITHGFTGWCSCHASPLSTSLLLLGFTSQHSCCTSLFSFLGLLRPICFLFTSF